MRFSYLTTFLSLGFVLIVDSLVMGIVFPMMGALFINPHEAIVPATTSLLQRDILYSLTMGGFFLCAIIGAPFLGDLSDMIGRRKVLLISLIAGGISCLGAAAAISLKLVWLLILARAVAGLASGNQTLANAAIIDISSPENKARNIGFITLALCMGFILGPLIGGVFSDPHVFKILTPATPFLIAAVFAFIAAFGIFFTFRETFNPPDQKTLHIGRGLTLLVEGFKHVKLRQWIGIYLLAQLGWGIYFQSISLLLAQYYHYTTAHIGLFMAYVAALFAVGSGILIPILLKYFKLVPLLLAGLLMVIVPMFFNLIFMKSIVIQWVTLIVFIPGQALIYTLTMTLVSNAVDKNAQGWAMGIATAVGSFAWGLAAFVIGAAVNLSVYLPFTLAMLLFIGTYSLVIRQKRRQQCH